MTYNEATDFLFSALPLWERQGGDAYKPGLERVTAFLECLGNPQNSIKTIHIAGTNGKGSTAHMLAAVLRASGRRTGLFTSPHLVDFRERIRIDGATIPPEAVVGFTTRWHDEMIRNSLTFFELATAMGLWWFAENGVDIAVIETGLGGRLDSTNVITPLVSVITNIALEHTHYLGVTLAAIAREKGGIIKPGVPVVIGETTPETRPVFREIAVQNHSQLIVAQRVTEKYDLDLQGDYQQKNLATVLATVDVLRKTIDITEPALRKGLMHSELQGRWQVVATRPTIVLDTAHNAHGIAEVVRQIARQTFSKLFLVLGFASDKDLDAIVKLLPPDGHYILTAADTPRAVPPDELAKKMAGFSTEIAPDVPSAIARARHLATPRDMIFIGGSNFVVAEALPLFS